VRIISLMIAISHTNKVLKVGALQDVRSDLAKLRGVLFYKILEELHSHLYNNGEYRYVLMSDCSHFVITNCGVCQLANVCDSVEGLAK
jgi:hypothetical protein